MSAFDALPRSAVVLNAYSRHHWGPAPNRTVRVVAIQTEAGLVARVIGSEDGRAVVLEEAAATEADRRGVTLADGTRLEVRPISGCGCQVPPALKGLDPRKV